MLSCTYFLIHTHEGLGVLMPLREVQHYGEIQGGTLARAQARSYCDVSQPFITSNNTEVLLIPEAAQSPPLSIPAGTKDCRGTSDHQSTMSAWTTNSGPLENGFKFPQGNLNICWAHAKILDFTKYFSPFSQYWINCFSVTR